MSLFFIPIIPLGSSYDASCTVCGVASKIDRGQAEQILSGAV